MQNAIQAKLPRGQSVEHAIEDLRIEAMLFLQSYRSGGRTNHMLLNQAMKMTKEALRLRKLQKFSKSRMTLSRIGIINLGEQK